MEICYTAPLFVSVLACPPLRFSEVLIGVISVAFEESTRAVDAEHRRIESTTAIVNAASELRDTDSPKKLQRRASLVKLLEEKETAMVSDAQLAAAAQVRICVPRRGRAGAEEEAGYSWAGRCRACLRRASPSRRALRRC